MSEVSVELGSSHATPVAESTASLSGPLYPPMPLKFYLVCYCGYWAILCTGVLSVWSVDSEQRACACLNVASSVWQIFIHSLRMRLEPFEMHCW